jgi:Homeodomain-like domain
LEVILRSVERDNGACLLLLHWLCVRVTGRSWRIWRGCRALPSGLAKRARMVLLAADGMPNAEIARVTGVSRPTVIGWRDRHARGGNQGAGG